MFGIMKTSARETGVSPPSLSHASAMSYSENEGREYVYLVEPLDTAVLLTIALFYFICKVPLLETGVHPLLPTSPAHDKVFPEFGDGLQRDGRVSPQRSNRGLCRPYCWLCTAA